ncbi:sensor histidine kinase [Planctomicrobium sp. SH661]|uniref:sensor histidine kinase n=1 Tax=Planctomicrobium sp. SH661 TaxID=3448124 RepID=UPI003F5C1EA3
MVSSKKQDATAATELQALRTRLSELEQQLLMAQKMGSVGELASSITHEFNNILTTIINYAKLGLRHQDKANRDKAFDKILTAGQRAAKITTGLLSYARAKDNRREPNSLAKLVQDMLVLVDKDLQVHRIRLETHITGDPYAEVNPGEIQQVLMNLLVNARQAMQPGGTLTVTVSESEDEAWAEISIQDTGSGIPADKLPHIFTRFFTTKTTDQNGQGGTGLGLALCKNIMDAHQGRIRVESAVGRGTKFTLKFPRVARPNLAGACGLDTDSLKSPSATSAEPSSV